MKPRIIYLHGNQATHWSFAWAKWLKQELKKLDYPTFFETFPDSVIAREEYWIPFLQDHIKASENDVLVGWSSGGTAALRYAENHQVQGSILVAPCYTDLGDVLEKQSGYYTRPWQWERIRGNQQQIVLFHSDNDPFIPREEFVHIAQSVQGERVELPGKGHFIDQETFPELLAYIQKTY